jgi:hypothetical protein
MAGFGVTIEDSAPQLLSCSVDLCLTSQSQFMLGCGWHSVGGARTLVRSRGDNLNLGFFAQPKAIFRVSGFQTRARGVGDIG